jgi:hypothetical protein
MLTPCGRDRLIAKTYRDIISICSTARRSPEGGRKFTVLLLTNRCHYPYLEKHLTPDELTPMIDNFQLF